MGAFERFFRLSPVQPGLTELLALYNNVATCNCDTHIVKLNAENTDDYAKVFDSLIDDMYSGELLPEMIHVPYYNYVAKVLTEAITIGLGGKSFGADDYRNSLLNHFQQNIYAFSGAKSLTVLKQYNSFLLDADGKLVSKERFKSRVADIDPILSVNHLYTERHDAISAAQMADSWETLKKFDFLEYSTVGDGNVRPKHYVLDGLIIASNDHQLDLIYPIKDHGCRCLMKPASTNAVPTNRGKVKQLSKGLETKPYFKGHVGKEKIVYNGEHPYYKNVDGKESDLQAMRNYNMRSAQQIYDLNDLPKLDYLNPKDALLNWGPKMEKHDFFTVKGLNNITIKFDEEFKRHSIKDNPDNRLRFLHKHKEVVQNPDEIWSFKKNGIVETRYLKYYDDFPVCVATNEARAYTMFQAKTGDKINLEGLNETRRGQLIYKNENR